MNFENAKELFNKINIELNEEQYNMFCKYEKLLLDWNQKMNLTAITDDKEIWLKHFVDSCTICKHTDNNSSVIDVGTGAGFPSIPLYIINSSTSLTLLDSLNKRITFLNEVCKELNIENANLIHERAEILGQNKNYREKFDVATARAVARLNVLTEYCLPFVKPHGKLICMKANDCEDEIKEAEKAIKLLGGKITKIEKITLPNSDIERTIIIIEKIAKTPEQYPRKSNLIEKKSL